MEELGEFGVISRVGSTPRRVAEGAAPTSPDAREHTERNTERAPVAAAERATQDGGGGSGETTKAITQLSGQLEKLRADMTAIGQATANLEKEVVQISESQRRVEGLLLTLATKLGTSSTQI